MVFGVADVVDLERAHHPAVTEHLRLVAWCVQSAAAASPAVPLEDSSAPACPVWRHPPARPRTHSYRLVSKLFSDREL